jgi:RNA polymerase sigma-70 factor (sigma-E family)
MYEKEFAEFVTERRPVLRRKAYLMCQDWHQADDMVQAVLIKLYRRWPQLERRTELSGYLHTMLVRELATTRRSSASTREVLSDELPERPSPGVPQDHVPDRLLLRDALAKLGKSQRNAVILRYVDRLSAEEVATTLGCSVTTVRSQSCRGLANLRTILATLEHEAEVPAGRSAGGRVA